MGKTENNAVPTVEELQKKVEQLQGALDVEAKETFDLRNKCVALDKEKSDLSSIAEDLDKQLTTLKAEYEMLKAVNDELTNELEAISKKDLKAVVEASQTKAAPVLSTESFTVGGKSYGFNYPVMVYKGKRITNDDILASTELQAELVAAGHSMIKAK